MKTARALATLALLTGCDYTYRLSDTVLLQPDECVNSGLLGQGNAMLRQAVSVWNAQGAHYVLAEDLTEGQKVDATIPVTCSSDLPTGAIGFYENFSGNLKIGRVYWTHPMWDPYYAPNMPYALDVVVHELGHSLGMKHLLDPNATLNWQAHDFTGLNASDLAGLACAQTGTGCDTVGFDPKHTS